MDCYEVEIGGKRKQASEILRIEEGIGGNSTVLEVIGDIYVGGGPAKTVRLQVFQLATHAELDDVEEALEKLGLEPPTQEIAIKSAAIIPDEVLQQGELVFPHTEFVEIPASGQMLENLIVIGWSTKAGMKEFMLRLKNMGFPAGTTFIGVIPEE